ncbi:hypothetical protein BB561_003426 [Smittium simulii]|uniref:Uncharacterized protein n=1 Tax=Smittium simulii TaxID=133385 RepID=A0A2T9YLH8_9FUNG|nr:hypothetical protein BB561_003426 [Smittium simulii]
MFLNAETTYLPTRAVINKKRYDFPDPPVSESIIQENLNECKSIIGIQTLNQMDKLKLLNETIVKSDKFTNNNFQKIKRLIKNAIKQDYDSMLCYKNVCDLHFVCIVKLGTCSNTTTKNLNLSVSEFEIFKNRKQEILDYINGVIIKNKDSYKNEITHIMQTIIPIYEDEAIKFV